MTPYLESWFVTELQNKSAPRNPALQSLAQLTVIIPCYGRQDFILRQCVYWHKSGASVVIVDGSLQVLPEGVRKRILALGDIIYLHAAVSMMDRLSIAAEQIKTPYAILCGDDEFLLFTGLCCAINLLEREPELAACIGQSLAFYPSGDGVNCTYGAGYPHWQYSITQTTVNARFAAAMTNYTAATCYAVLRADVWRKSWGRMQQWSSPYVSEMQQGLMTYILGSLKTVDEVYWMRSSENKPVTSIDFNRGISFKEWWRSSKFKLEHTRFINSLSTEMVAARHFTSEQAELAICSAIELFIDDSDRLERFDRQAIVFFRAIFIGVIKVILPETLLFRLKSKRFQSLKLHKQGELGNLRVLQGTIVPTPYRINPELVAELSLMEQIIADFYRVRSVQK